MNQEPGPWITYSAIRWIQSMLRNDMRIFEWGSGKSTLWFAERVRSITSIEDDPSWFHRVNEWIAEAGLLNAQVNLIQRSAETGWKLYAEVILNLPGPFDLIYIDGHLDSRKLCAEAAVKAAGDTTIILLDNSDTMTEAAAILEEWSVERATFYGAGSGKQRWASTFYYPFLERNPLSDDI